MNNINKVIWIVIISFLIITPLIGILVFDDEDIYYIKVFERKNYTLPNDFIDNKGLNKAAVEDYLRQRSLFRAEIIILFRKLNLKLGVSHGPYNDIIVGGDGWYFGSDVLNYDNRIGSINEGAMNKTALFIKDYIDYYKSKQVDFIYFIIPSASSIYPEYLPSYHTTGENNGQFNDYISDIISKNKITDNFIDMKPVLLEVKKKSDYLLYYKTDGHWTEFSAYLAYLEVMNKLNAFDSSYKPLILDEPVIKNESHMLTAGAILGTGLTENTFEDVELGDREPIQPVFLTDDITWWGLQHYYCKDALNNKNALLIGNSFLGDPNKLFTDIPRQAFAHTFENLYFIHMRKLFNGKEENNYLQNLISYYDIDAVIYNGRFTESFPIYEDNLDLRRFTSDFSLTVDKILVEEKCKSAEFSDGVLNIIPSGKNTSVLIKFITLEEGVSKGTMTIDSDESTDIKIEFLDIDQKEIYNYSLYNISAGTKTFKFEKKLSQDVEFIRLNLVGKSNIYSISDFYIDKDS
jgi:hypothetical protein